MAKRPRKARDPFDLDVARRLRAIGPYDLAAYPGCCEISWGEVDYVQGVRGAGRPEVAAFLRALCGGRPVWVVPHPEQAAARGAALLLQRFQFAAYAH